MQMFSSPTFLLSFSSPRIHSVPEQVIIGSETIKRARPNSELSTIACHLRLQEHLVKRASSRAHGTIESDIKDC